jgi:probable phosphomutase (TIGR03848 family)/uncharacterized repeat protein (TIGR03847 family)
MTVLVLIRHATNDYVTQGRLAGWTPGIHINARGQREADALARRLNDVPIAAIFSSPLERAVDTARAVALCQKLEVQVREELGEFRVGEWTGKLIRELEGTETWKQLQTKPVGVRLPGGESIDQVQVRMVQAIDAIVKAHPKQVVAVVSHADPLKATIAHYMGMDLNQFQRIIINPASVTVFLFDEEQRPALFRLNDTGDLPSFKPEPHKKPAPATSQADMLADAGSSAVQGNSASQNRLARDQAGSEGMQVQAPPAKEQTSERDEAERKDKEKMPEANILYDLNPVTQITVGAVGVPGKRTFYLQGRQGRTLVTLTAEKEQVAALSTGIDQLLDRLGWGGRAVQVTAAEMELSEPIEPLFRIGQLGLGYDAEQNLLVLVAYELPQEEEAATVNVVRFWASQEQMRALARHSAAIVAAGRPICVLCGRPIDPQGHFCPKRNGHGEHATLT